MKEIKDFKTYLDHIDTLSKTMSSEQKVKLANILSVMLTLLVCLKKSSEMGKCKFNFEE